MSDEPVCVPACRVCGCTEDVACTCEQPDRYGTCYWVEDDLCSACAGLPVVQAFRWDYWDPPRPERFVRLMGRVRGGEHRVVFGHVPEGAPNGGVICAVYDPGEESGFRYLGRRLPRKALEWLRGERW